MRTPLLLVVLSAVLFGSCSNGPKSRITSILNNDSLKVQVFDVDINKDTVLVTKSGCIIRLPKGSLQSNDNNIKLEIKEALTNTDIVLAGLTTMNGGRSLSSGGMLYMNAAEGYKVEIAKAVEVLVPTKTYDPDMQVFKGVEKDDGRIDWTEPVALPKDSTLLKIDNGEILFKSHCASCHKIEKDLTAPALYGVTDRRPKQWLYAFTRNSEKLIQDGFYEVGNEQLSVSDSTGRQIIPDSYSACLYHTWNGAPMNAFPSLSDADLDALYSYIKTESDKLPKPKGTLESCCDSCDRYGKALYEAYGYIKSSTQDQNFFNLDRSIPLPVSNDTTVATTTMPVATSSEIKETVKPSFVKATYYTMNIETFGWYNIDILMKDSTKCEPSELFVRIHGSYEIDLNVVLVIPSAKAFIEGGKLDDGKKYGFYETDGNIPLPMNEQCYILAFGENEGGLIFGKRSFMAAKNQTIDIDMAVTTKEDLIKQIKVLNLDGVSVEIEELHPESSSIQKNDTLKAVVEKLRPKNCNCGFLR